MRNSEDFQSACDKAKQLAALLPRIALPPSDAMHDDDEGALMRLAFDIATDLASALWRIN